MKDLNAHLRSMLSPAVEEVVVVEVGVKPESKGAHLNAPALSILLDGTETGVIDGLSEDAQI